MSAITMADASFVQHREPFRFYLRLTHSLLSDPRTNVFNAQGTTVFSNATVGYCDIITTPMDPGTIWHNLTGRVKYVRKLNGRPPFFDESLCRGRHPHRFRQLPCAERTGYSVPHSGGHFPARGR